MKETEETPDTLRAEVDRLTAELEQCRADFLAADLGRTEQEVEARDDAYEEVRRLASEMDTLYKEYALVPKPLWAIVQQWPAKLQRAAQVAPFTMSLRDRANLQEAQRMLPEVIS